MFNTIENQRYGENLPIIRLGEKFAPFKDHQFKIFSPDELTDIYNSPVPTLFVDTVFVLKDVVDDSVPLSAVNSSIISLSLVLLNRKMIEEALRLSAHTTTSEKIIFSPDSQTRITRNGTAIEAPLDKLAQAQLNRDKADKSALLVTDIPLGIRTKFPTSNLSQREFVEAVDLEFKIADENYYTNKSRADRSSSDYHNHTSEILLYRKGSRDGKIVILPYNEATLRSIFVTPQLH